MARRKSSNAKRRQTGRYRFGRFWPNARARRRFVKGFRSQPGAVQILVLSVAFVVLACAEDSAGAVSDGAVLGCRVGMLAGDALTLVDVRDASGCRSLLKLEGIERRAGSSTEFDVAVDVDRPATPALLGRLVWEWR